VAQFSATGTDLPKTVTTIGSTTAIVNGSGQGSQSPLRRAFGGVITAAGAPTDSPTTSPHTSPATNTTATGLLNTGGRIYDPARKTFTTPDLLIADTKWSLTAERRCGRGALEDTRSTIDVSTWTGAGVALAGLQLPFRWDGDQSLVVGLGVHAATPFRAWAARSAASRATSSLRGRPRGRLRAMTTPRSKISPPQTPHGSCRASAEARQTERTGQSPQRTLARSSSFGVSANQRSGLTADRQGSSRPAEGAASSSSLTPDPGGP